MPNMPVTPVKPDHDNICICYQCNQYMDECARADALYYDMGNTDEVFNTPLPFSRNPNRDIVVEVVVSPTTSKTKSKGRKAWKKQQLEKFAEVPTETEDDEYGCFQTPTKPDDRTCAKMLEKMRRAVPTTPQTQPQEVKLNVTKNSNPKKLIAAAMQGNHQAGEWLKTFHPAEAVLLRSVRA